MTVPMMPGMLACLGNVICARLPIHPTTSLPMDDSEGSGLLCSFSTFLPDWVPPLTGRDHAPPMQCTCLCAAMLLCRFASVGNAQRLTV